MSAKIEKGVPLQKSGSKWPWQSLEVGDSFVNPTPSKFFGSTISAMGRLRGVKFSYRTQPDGSIRVWRVA